MDHAGDIAARLKRSAALAENGCVATESTKRSNRDKNVFLVLSGDGSYFRVTVEQVTASDLTTEQLYLEQWHDPWEAQA